jgi:hypothetical protein
VLRAVILALIATCCACSGPQKRPINWRDDMERWFSNNSTRPNETPRSMWSREEEDLLQLRVGSAEYAAIGTFRLLSIYSTFSSPKQLALVFRPQETLHGKLDDRLDKEGELMLQLTPSNSEDFRLAVQLQKQLPGKRFIVFLKEQPTGDDRVLLRWALYGDDKELIAEIRAMYQWLEQEKHKK